MAESISNEVRWIHLLLRGDKESSLETDQNDEYINLFSENDLTAITVPVLEFKFFNLEILADSIKKLATPQTDVSTGLIITSPRVVEALSRVSKSYGVGDLVEKIDSDLVFVVGEKSARDCQAKLRLKYNLNSSKTGCAKALAEYIKDFWTPTKPLRLIYPKGSRSYDLIENILSTHAGITIERVVVYDTNPIEDIDSNLIAEIRNLDVFKSSISKLIIHLIFFSPSGLGAFAKANQKLFVDQLKRKSIIQNVEMKYSAIGETTRAALISYGLDVYCVSEKPNALSLVKAITDNLGHKTSNDIGQT